MQLVSFESLTKKAANGHLRQFVGNGAKRVHLKVVFVFLAT